MFNSGTAAGGNREEPYRSILEYAPTLYFRLNDATSTAVNIGSSSGNGTSTSVTTGDTPVPTRSIQPSSTFNGTTSFITRTDGVISGTLPTFSVGLWIVVTATPGSTATLFQMKDTTNNGSGLAIKLDSSGQLTVTGVNNSGTTDFAVTVPLGGTLTTFLDDGTTYTTPKVLLDGLAHQIGVTARSSTVDVYVDGRLVGSAFPRTSGTWSTTGDTFIGRTNTAAEYFTGRISDVFVTATQLTNDQWAALHYNSKVNPPSPNGDNWLDAPVIPADGHTNVSLTLKDSRREPGELSSGFVATASDTYSSWFKFTPVTSGSYDVVYPSALRNGAFVTPPHFNPSFPILASGSALSSLSFVSPAKIGYDFVRYTLTGGTTYSQGWPGDLIGNNGPYYVDSISMFVRPAAAAPFNDNFANALTIDVTAPGTYNGTNYASSDEAGETLAIGAGTWFQFVPAISGNITFDTELSSTTDTNIVVVTGSVVGSTSVVASDVNSGVNETARITAAVTSGTTYHVKVSDPKGGVVLYILRWTAVA